jgi:histidine ammonia-lyase
MNEKDPHHSNEVVLTGETLTIEDVIAVARDHKRVSLLGEHSAVEVKKRIEKSANWVKSAIEELENCLEKGEQPRAYYGINTGFGHQAGKAAFRDPEDAKWLSRNLIVSHAVGVGDYFEEEVVRAAMLIRANTLAKGYSGVRLEVINTLVEMLNKGVHPAVPEKGSVGSSGDLAPLSHLALVMSRAPGDSDDEKDSGEVLVKTENGWGTISGKAAMERAGVERIVLGAKEGLALNNGATFSAALAALAVHDAGNLVQNAEVALAMSHEALQGFRDPFFAEVHNVRPHPGQIITSDRMLRLMQGSELLDGDRDRNPENCPPQDSYSQRCAPQVIGAVRDTLAHIRRVVEIELNAATDNPLIFIGLDRDYKSVSCGNFHGEPVAFAMDFLGIAITELGNIAERRIFKLTDAPRRPREKAYILPSCLVKEDAEKVGLNSGFLLPQYTAAALVSDCKTLAHPDSVDSIPTSGNKEDHVSMSTNAARHAREIVWNIQQVIAIEMMCAAQALDFRLAGGRQIKVGAGTRRAYERIRRDVKHLGADRVLYHDIRKMANLVQTNMVVEAAWTGLDKGKGESLDAEIRKLQAKIKALEERKRRLED